MTISYTLEVSNARLCGFVKLLIRWKGSIYKLMTKEMLIFIGLYYSLSMLYRYGLSSEGRLIFEKICIYCNTFTNLIPLSFVLGFYVSIVVNRWWEQVTLVPTPDKLAFLVSTYISGPDERGRIIRRTIMRYINLTMVMMFQLISTAVKKRFPTIDHIQETGLMTKEERTLYDSINCPTGKWWLPIAWTCSLISRARKEGRIKDEIAFNSLIQEVYEIRSNCGRLFLFDWISVPLVYTQVVTLAIYMFFLSTLMGRQYLDPKKGYAEHDVDLYIPVFTILQFFFYMGWLKVAEQLINPFGEDDDDFECNYIIDRLIQVPFLIVDEMYQKHPKIVKDMFWDDAEPKLPYTKSSLINKIKPFLGSTAHLDVDQDQGFLPMSSILEEDSDDHEYRGSGSITTKDPSSGKYFVEVRDSKILNYILGQKKPEPPNSLSSSYESKKESSTFLNPLHRINSSLLHRSPSESKAQSRKKRETRSIAGSIIGSIKNKNPFSDSKINRYSDIKSNTSLASPLKGESGVSIHPSTVTSLGNLAPSSSSYDHKKFRSQVEINMQAKSSDNLQSPDYVLTPDVQSSRFSVQTPIFEMDPEEKRLTKNDESMPFKNGNTVQQESYYEKTYSSCSSYCSNDSELDHDTITSVIDFMKKEQHHRKHQNQAGKS